MMIMCAVKLLQLAKIESIDVPADAAFGKGQCHPRFIVQNHAWAYRGMLREKVIQSVGPGHHQRLEPCRTAAIAALQAGRVDEQSLTKIAVDGFLAFGLRQ